MANQKYIHSDNIEYLRTLPENSVDSVVTDAPYGLGKEPNVIEMLNAWITVGYLEVTGTGFMGKKWDAFVPQPNFWKEVFRVLKPGGNVLCFFGTRTYDWGVMAMRIAGFEVRDQLQWIYGQGFPKSLDISKAISEKIKIGLCTCIVNKQSLPLSYEKDNERRDYISNGEDDGFIFGNKIQYKRGDNKKVAEQKKNTHLQKDFLLTSKNDLCELPKADSETEKGFNEVGKPILRARMCEPVYEKKRLGNAEIREGMEKDKATSSEQRYCLPNLPNKTGKGIGSSPSSPIQNGWKKHNEQFSRTLQELSQQDRENNRKGISKNEDDCKIEQWNIDNRLICSECGKLKQDIGGTALKPANEPIVLARKPIEKGLTIAENVLKWGTGGLNIDASRIKTSDIITNHSRTLESSISKGKFGNSKGQHTHQTHGQHLGRFPANVLFDEAAAYMLDQQSGCLTSGIPSGIRTEGQRNTYNSYGSIDVTGYGDSGGASRFFYVAKPSKAERNQGLENFEPKKRDEGRIEGNSGGDNPRNRGVNETQNFHPTVKPIRLMQYLVHMVTPIGGKCIDPFNGSGPTGIACGIEDIEYEGIDNEEDYILISQARADSYKSEISNQLGLFDDGI